MPPRTAVTRICTHLQCTPRRTLTTTATRRANADYAHVVIGGGAVGLSVARHLASRGATLLLERHPTAGTETSSRNSEVIHAGLYYGHGTLKTELCIRGRQLLYEFCDSRRVPHSNCGKWIVAQDEMQMGEVQKVAGFAKEVGVPVRFLSREEAVRREPDVRAREGVLESSSTGIVDSHAYMQALEGELQARGGEVGFGNEVTRIEALGGDGSGGWRIYTNESENEEDAITAETLVNSAGLAAVHISNMILPKERQRTPYYAKGSYYSYSASRPKTSTLVYPAPMPGHGGLGTHLTLDMGGRIRFGPDVEWVDDPTDLSVNDNGFVQALDDIQTYLPGLQRDAVALDYCGIRPKLGKSSAVVSGSNFIDFYIEKEHGFQGFVNLLGIESPGLTSSLAIAELVHDMMYTR